MSIGPSATPVGSGTHTRKAIGILYRLDIQQYSQEDYWIEIDSCAVFEAVFNVLC